MRSIVCRTALLAFSLALAASCSRSGIGCEATDKGCCPDGEVEDDDGECCKEEDMDGGVCSGASFSGMTAAEEAEAWAKWLATK